MAKSRFNLSDDQIGHVIAYLSELQRQNPDYLLDPDRVGRLFFGKEIKMPDAIQAEVEKVFSRSEFLSELEKMLESHRELPDDRRYLTLGIEMRHQIFFPIEQSPAWKRWSDAFKDESERATVNDLVKGAVAYKLLLSWYENQKKYTDKEIFPVIKALAKVFALPVAEHDRIMKTLFATLQYEIKDAEARNENAMKVLQFLDEHLPVAEGLSGIDKPLMIGLMKAAFDSTDDMGAITYPVLHKKFQDWLVEKKRDLLERSHSREREEKSLRKAASFFGESPASAEEKEDKKAKSDKKAEGKKAKK